MFRLSLDIPYLMVGAGFVSLFLQAHRLVCLPRMGENKWDQVKWAHCRYSFPCVSEASIFCFVSSFFFSFVTLIFYYQTTERHSLLFPFPNTHNRSNFCEWKLNVYKIVIIIA